MQYLSPYLRLMRLHQPVGVWLLFWPCAWSVALAGGRNFKTYLLFFVGAVLMRSAGCIVNDMADREFDGQVERTKTRPLASGELNMQQAIALLVILLLLSLGVAFALGPVVIMWGALALVPVGIYPLMKRVSWWPQLFLGLTFNWGALVGWSSVQEDLKLPAILLYAGGVCWSLGYDTIYAHQDKIDDARIGVRSTALKLGSHTKIFVSSMYGASVLLWACASGGAMYFALLALVAAHFAWQVWRVELDVPESARKIFFSNAWLGFVMFSACITSRIFY